MFKKMFIYIVILIDLLQISIKYVRSPSICKMKEKQQNRSNIKYVRPTLYLEQKLNPTFLLTLFMTLIDNSGL